LFYGNLDCLCDMIGQFTRLVKSTGLAVLQSVVKQRFSPVREGSSTAHWRRPAHHALSLKHANFLYEWN
jgi:hypothetical protein